VRPARSIGSTSLSDFPGEYARIQRAFAQPTLALVHRAQAPLVVAVFRAAFSRENRAIPTARLHDRVDEYLRELELAAYAVPSGSGKQLCQDWVRGQWLVRSLDDQGVEVYSMTSHALEALGVVQRLLRDRATLSEHRIATIIAAVRKFNATANPDRQSRISILDAEIERLSAERNRLADGMEIEQVSAEYMLEGFTELLQLVAALPSDFSRVDEAFGALRGSILADFRAEQRNAGEVIDEYLRKADALMTATPEGRAFEGAFALLRDDELLLQLRQDLTALLDHPLSAEILMDGDRVELRGTVGFIREGIESVLAQRHRVSATLRDYIVTHDIARDRELDDVLRQLEQSMTVWMQSAGPRDTVPISFLPSETDIEHLRERFYDPLDDDDPPLLAERDVERPGTLTLEEIRQRGGPTLAALAERLEKSLGLSNDTWSAGALFDGFPEDLKRPVEVLGLLLLATDRGDLERVDEYEDFTAVRPDGSRSELLAPRLQPTVREESRGD